MAEELPFIPGYDYKKMLEPDFSVEEQVGQRPTHFVSLAPQFWQTYIVFDFINTANTFCKSRIILQIY